MKLIRIETFDTFSIYGWQTKEEAMAVQPSPVTFGGFIIKETKDYILIAQGYDKNTKMVFSPLAIPKRGIKETHWTRHDDGFEVEVDEEEQMTLGGRLVGNN